MIAGLWDAILDHDYEEVAAFKMIDPEARQLQ
jgi:hypothetical protein